MKRYQEDVFVVGNIAILHPGGHGDDRTLHRCGGDEQLPAGDHPGVHPKVSAILNFTPDHLNRHHTMEAYVEAKKNIARNQTEDDYCVLNYEDERTRNSELR